MPLNRQKKKISKAKIKTCEYESDLRGNKHYLSSRKNKAWKNSGLYGIWTHDLCDTGTVLYQLSYQLVAGQAWNFFCPLFTTAQVVFITAEIAFILTSSSAIHIYDFHVITIKSKTARSNSCAWPTQENNSQQNTRSCLSQIPATGMWSLVVSNPYLFTIRRSLLKSPEGLGYRGVHADASTATTATETL